MRIYVTEEPWPASGAVLEAAGAAEIVHVTGGYPERLTALGIATPGLHEIADPTPPIPADPPRRLVAKSTVWARLRATGHLDAVRAILDGNRDAYDQWIMPGWPNVYADDPQAVAIIAAAGADVSVIMAEDPTVTP